MIYSIATMAGIGGSRRFDSRRHVIGRVRPVERAILDWRTRAERRATGRRWLWLGALALAVALAVALLLTRPADAGCVKYTAMGRVTNVSRVWWAPGTYSVAGYTFGRPTWYFAAHTKLAVRAGESVLATGCQSTERQLTGVTLRRP